MNIVHVTHRAWPVVGGAEQYVHEIARRQVATGHRVTVVATQAQALSALWSASAACVPETTSTEQDGVRIMRLPLRYLPCRRVSIPHFTAHHLVAFSPELLRWRCLCPAFSRGFRRCLRLSMRFRLIYTSHGI